MVAGVGGIVWEFGMVMYALLFQNGKPTRTYYVAPGKNKVYI